LASGGFKVEVRTTKEGAQKMNEQSQRVQQKRLMKVGSGHLLLYAWCAQGFYDGARARSRVGAA
jgi:hypothetical protein